MCIFKFSNTQDYQFGRKTALYWPNDLSTLTDVIGEYCIHPKENIYIQQNFKGKTSENAFNSFYLC